MVYRLFICAYLEFTVNLYANIHELNLNRWQKTVPSLLASDAY